MCRCTSSTGEPPERSVSTGASCNIDGASSKVLEFFYLELTQFRTSKSGNSRVKLAAEAQNR